MRKQRHKKVIIPAGELGFNPKQVGSRGFPFTHSVILHPKISVPHLSQKVRASPFLHLNTPRSSLSGTSGGKLNPPPAPPARSPTTELSSKSQQAPAWTPTQQPGGQLRNGSLHIIGKQGHCRPCWLPVKNWIPRAQEGVCQPVVLSF